MNKIKFEGIPTCATAKQYMSWLSIARRVPPWRAGFCEDCSQEYADRMGDEGRCEHPEIVFDHDGDGCIPTPYMLDVVLAKLNAGG